MLTASAEAESNCSSSCMTRLLCRLCCNKLFLNLLFKFPPPGGAAIDDDPEPVEVVSEMEELDENGGKLRSEGEGEEGAPEAVRVEAERASRRQF